MQLASGMRTITMPQIEGKGRDASCGGVNFGLRLTGWATSLVSAASSDQDERIKHLLLKLEYYTLWSCDLGYKYHFRTYVLPLTDRDQPITVILGPVRILQNLLGGVFLGYLIFLNKRGGVGE